MVVDSLGVWLVCLPKNHAAVSPAAYEIVPTLGEAHIPYGLLMTAIGADACLQPQAPELDGPIDPRREEIELVLRKRQRSDLLSMANIGVIEGKVSTRWWLHLFLLFILLRLAGFGLVWVLRGQSEVGNRICLGLHVPDFDSPPSRDCICLFPCNYASIVMKEEDIAFEFLIGAKMSKFLDPYKKPGLCKKLPKPIFRVVLRQVVLPLLLRHLEVSIIVGVYHIDLVEAHTSSEYLLLGLALRLLSSIGQLRQGLTQPTELKHSDQIAQHAFGVRGRLRTRIGIRYN